ncbi:MAG: DEAD/DEAH box helicase family protein [Planctomycetia bacterium]|nr:DEAD/DEAH box helicase family protein [Planctomycetia bacterium]
MNEADTCRKLVRPKLEAAGWEDGGKHFYSEQTAFTDGRIIVPAGKPRRLKKKFTDFLLRYSRDITLAVVEAKSDKRPAGDGLQQAKDYADILGLKFAYATNGHEIIEYDFFTALEQPVDRYPTPEELWSRYQRGQGLSQATSNAFLAPFFHQPGKEPRYYQKIAINRAVEAILNKKPRCLLTLATGTGKTLVSFQICWKLWSAGWNTKGEPRKPRILFLADRNILVDDPKDKTFAPFGDARWKIEGEAIKSREMYFSIYQAIAKDERRPGLYKEYAPDFFDLIVIDECHRGSARDESNWREILEHFEPAYQLGMTATPLREDNRDTYTYFGNPLYTYSLKQGIEDGFLAPYRVHRILTTVDAAGWRPNKGQKDTHGREIPDAEYHTKDFERTGGVSLQARTEAIAKHITDFLKKTDRHNKTIVFCVDQDHADQMRRALHNLNTDLIAKMPKGETYVARVTADEGDIGRGFLGKFQDPEERYPVILTTSQLLTTGVDAPTCQNVILVRTIGSMSEFKQIIGRGTRVRDDHGKLFFNILDYTGSATRLFADPDFDGDPSLVSEEEINAEGEVVETKEITAEEENPEADGPSQPEYDDEVHGPRKYYVRGGKVDIDTHVTYDLDSDGSKLRTVEITQYTAETIRTLYTDPDDLRKKWSDFEQRTAIVEMLEEKGIDFNELAATAGNPEADPYDLLCHLAYNAPLLTRKQRAEKLRKEKKDFFDQYGPEARTIINDLLDKYAEHGTKEFRMPEVFDVPPISNHGNFKEIARKFGGTEKLMEAFCQLQTHLYAA